MSWWNRVRKSLGGVVDTFEAAPQLAMDIAKAPFEEDDVGGFLGNVWGAVTYRTFDQFAGGLKRPFEQAYTAIPKSARNEFEGAASTVYEKTGLKALIGDAAPEKDDGTNKGLTGDEFFGHGILGFLESSYREFIGEPLSTAFTAGSLASRPGESFNTLLKAKTWSRAHEIAQARSPGQALTLAVSTKDILDEDELTKVQATDWYPIVSGALDAAARWYLSPDVLATKAIRPIKYAAPFARVDETGRLTGFGARAASKEWLRWDSEELVKQLDRRTTLQKFKDLGSGTAGEILADAKSQVQAPMREAVGANDLTGAVLGSDARMAEGLPVNIADNGIAMKLAPDPLPQHVIDDLTPPSNLQQAMNPAARRGVMDQVLTAESGLSPETLAGAKRQGIFAHGGNAMKEKLWNEFQNNPSLRDLPEEHMRAVEDFIDQIGDEKWADLYLAVGGESAKGTGLLGEYKFHQGLVNIYDRALTEGQFTRVTLHELNHHLAKFVPTRDVRQFQDEFAAVRKGFFDEFPELIPKLNGRTDWGNAHWTPGEVSTMLAKIDDPQRIAKLTSVIGEDVKGGQTVWRFLPTKENYRLFNIDEYFAEMVTDAYISGYGQSHIKYIDFGKEAFQRMAKSMSRIRDFRHEGWGSVGGGNGMTGYVTTTPSPGSITTFAEQILGNLLTDKYRDPLGNIVELRRGSLGGAGRVAGMASTFADEADMAIPEAQKIASGEIKLSSKEKLDKIFTTLKSGGIEKAIRDADGNINKATRDLQMSREYWKRNVAPDLADRLLSVTERDAPVYIQRFSEKALGRLQANLDNLNEAEIQKLIDAPIEDFGFANTRSWADNAPDVIKEAHPDVPNGIVKRSLTLSDNAIRDELTKLTDRASGLRKQIDNIKAKAAENPKSKGGAGIAVREKKLAALEAESKYYEWLRVQNAVPENPLFVVKELDSPEMLQAAKDYAIAEARAKKGTLPSFDERQKATLAFKTERIRDLMFPNSPDGELMASLLALSEDKQQMQVGLDILMGNIRSVKDMADMNPGLARSFEDLMKRRLITREFDITDLHTSVESYDAVMRDPETWISNGFGGDELKDSVGRAIDLEYNRDVVDAEMARMRMIVKGDLGISRGSELRTKLKYSKFWRSEKNPLHVMFDMVAQPIVNFDDPAYIGKLKRHYRDAGMTPEQQEYWLGRIGGLAGDARYNAFNESIADGIQSLARKHDITDADLIAEVRRQVSQGRIEAENMLLTANKQYAGYSEALGKNFSQIDIEIPGQTAMKVFYPISPEQLAQSHVMPNFYTLDKALAKVGKFRARNPGIEMTALMTKGLLDGVNHVWKPLVLLRPAWPMRVVLDEQLRMMSVIGTMKTLAHLPQGFDDMSMQFMRDYFPMRDETGSALFMAAGPDGKMITRSSEAGLSRSLHPMADPKKAARGVGAGGALLGAALGGAPGAGIGALGGAALGFKGAGRANRLTELRLSGLTRDLVFDRYNIGATFGKPGDRAELYYDELSAAKTRNALQDRTVSESFGRRNFDPQRSKMYFPDDPIYEKFWNEVTNKQFHNSTYSKMLWDDTMSNEDIVDWLLARGEFSSDLRGARTLRSMPVEFQENPEMLVERARGYLHSNVLPLSEPELAPFRDRLKEGGFVNFQEVKKALEDAGKDPAQVLGTIHGQDVFEIHEARNPLRRALNNTVDQTFKALGQVPTDNLSRNPFFEAVYQGSLKSEIAGHMAKNGEARIPEATWNVMQDQARRIALFEVRNVMYDLAENSRFSEMVSHLIPFFPAQQEVITRWAGLAIKNPLFFDRMMKVYDAPMKAGWTGTDSEGNDYVRLHIPGWAKPLVNKGFFKSAIDDQGYISFNPENLNMLNGSIGAGPVVNIAVAEIAKRRPEIENTLGFLYPYGIPTDLKEAVYPAWGRRLQSSAQEDRAYASAEYGIAISRIVKANLDGQPIDFSDPKAVSQFYSDVSNQAHKLFALRTAAALISPTAIQFRSPYQDFIDEFRKMKREDPLGAEDKFLAKHGEAYFALTQSFTKTLDGIPATFQAEAARDKYRPLVEAFPEFGSLIIGEEGAGAAAQFSNVIYKKQQREKISEGDPRTRRSMLSLKEVTTGSDVRLGWSEWSVFNDWLTRQMADRRITTLQAKGAEDLREKRLAFIEENGQKHPTWYEDFADQDETKWLRKIKAMKGIANSDAPGLSERHDIRGLKEYLDARDKVVAELARREKKGDAGSLTAKANRDVAVAWDRFQNNLVEKNLAFGSLWTRWLQNDAVQKNTWSVN